MNIKELENKLSDWSVHYLKNVYRDNKDYKVTIEKVGDNYVIQVATMKTKVLNRGSYYDLEFYVDTLCTGIDSNDEDKINETIDYLIDNIDRK